MVSADHWSIQSSSAKAFVGADDGTDAASATAGAGVGRGVGRGVGGRGVGPPDGGKQTAACRSVAMNSGVACIIER